MRFKKKIVEMKNRKISDIKHILQNNKEAIRFLLLFIFLSVFFFIVFFAVESYLDFLKIWTAHVASSFANFFGMHVTLEGIIITVDTIQLEIIQECTGIFIIMITVSCVLSYPAEIKDRIIGIIFVIPFILALNFIRLLFLIYIAKYQSDLFEYVHSYLWQGTFIIFIILAWFLWIELVVNR